jgi:hypothetical protein
MPQGGRPPRPIEKNLTTPRNKIAPRFVSCQPTQTACAQPEETPDEIREIPDRYDDCAKNWPPLMADGNAKPEGAYSIVDRKDGMKQWAKDGMPLYFWVKDKKMGDITGDGVKDVWDVAKP